MQASAAESLSSAPAPVVKARSATRVDYADIEKIARTSVLRDFYRQQGFLERRASIVRAGADVQVIRLSDRENEALVRASTSRLLKEHQSASWSVFFYQAGVFGLTGLASAATVGSLYIGLSRNRLFLAVSPIAAAVAWRLWSVLEEAWEQQRYIDNAAQVRAERKGNPMNQVVKRRRVTRAGQEEEDGVRDASVTEPGDEPGVAVNKAIQ